MTKSVKNQKAGLLFTLSFSLYKRTIGFMMKKQRFKKQTILCWYFIMAALFAVSNLTSHASCSAATQTQEAGGTADARLVPKSIDLIIATMVASQLPKEHISKHPLDKEISKRTLALYLKTLDPLKYYFYQSDIDEFTKSEDALCDMIKSGNIKIAFDIFNVYLDRFDERTAMAQQILAGPIDFTVDEDMIIDKDMLKYPQNKDEAFDRTRKKVKSDILFLKAEAKDSNDSKSDTAEAKAARKKAQEDPVKRLQRRYESTRKRIHQTTNDEVLELFLTSLTGAYDPHSSYMSESTRKNFDIQMGLHLEGIGASLASEDGVTVIKKIIPGGAADKDGRLKVEDKIIGVGQGKDGEIVDVVDMKINDVVDKIRGDRGTVVRLEIIPEDGSGNKIIEIVREQIELKDSEAQSMIFEEGKKEDGTPFRIGVIDLPSFYLDMEAAQRGDPNAKSTTEDVRAILDKFNAEKVDAVVLDLSKNGGGSLPEAVALTGLFIETGTVVQRKRSDEAGVRADIDHDPGISWAGPLVVVVSKFSASASEIFAGAIRDYKRGIIVGDSRTHGKGSVQAMTVPGRVLLPLLKNQPPYGAIKLTIERFYRPAGASPQIKGVDSDVVIPSITDYIKDISEADLDYPLSYDQVPSGKFPVFNFVTPEIVEKLRAGSAKRIAVSEDFQKIERNIKLYTELKDRKSFSLNEEKFNAERERLNTDKEEKEKLEKIINNDSKIVRDYFLNEVLAITVDYLKLLKEAGTTFGKPTSPQRPSSFLFF